MKKRNVENMIILRNMKRELENFLDYDAEYYSHLVLHRVNSHMGGDDGDLVVSVNSALGAVIEKAIKEKIADIDRQMKEL